MAFTPSRPLLNPHFEGYKLSFTPTPHIVHVPLEHKPSQSRVGTRALGFQEVSSRVRHNHLAVGESIDSAVYIADDGSVVFISAGDELCPVDNSGERSGVTINVVFRLPGLATVSQRQAEYPAAAYVTHNLWLIGDGHGYAYLLQIDRPPASGGAKAQLLSHWQLQTDDVLTPFQLHTVGLVDESFALAILSSSPSAVASSPKATFDIWAVRVPIIDPPSQATFLQGEMPPAFEVAWRRHGTHIPLFVKYVPTNHALLFLGGSSYRDNVTPATSGSYEPKPDEIVPIPRLGESLDAPVPPPYSWTQTDDTVTVAFALPGPTPKSTIVVTFEPSALSVHAGNPPLPQPQYKAAPLWDAIHPSSSLWTWERGDLNRAGLLSLHLDKLHTGTRWSSIFAQGFEVVDVPETVDPSELAKIRETLDKYTAALQDGAGGFGQNVPSLATGERDNEIDAEVGNPVEPTWVGVDGGADVPPNDSSVVLLSLPLPGTPGPLTLVVKNDIDGPLYTLDDAHTWSHTATYPALAFVLASKRDTRFTFHISSTVTFAFDSGARNNGGGNVYLYHGSTPSDKWAKQSVFQLRAGAGPLLGVGMVTSRAGHTSLLCLSEKELTVCHGPL